MVARYNPDGTLDTGFVSGGKLTFDFGFFGDAAKNVAVQPDGKIVLGGSSYTSTTGGARYALARVNPNCGFRSFATGIPEY